MTDSDATLTAYLRILDEIVEQADMPAHVKELAAKCFDSTEKLMQAMIELGRREA